MNDDEIKNFKFNDSRKNLNDVHLNTMFWKNDHMNYIEAENIVNELFNNNDFDLLMDNMFDNFELGNIVHGNKNISDRLGIRTSRLDDKVKSYMTSVIRDSKIDAYKERKLSI